MLDDKRLARRECETAALAGPRLLQLWGFAEVGATAAKWGVKAQRAVAMATACDTGGLWGRERRGAWRTVAHLDETI